MTSGTQYKAFFCFIQDCNEYFSSNYTTSLILVTHSRSQQPPLESRQYSQSNIGRQLTPGASMCSPGESKRRIAIFLFFLLRSREHYHAERGVVQASSLRPPSLLFARRHPAGGIWSTELEFVARN